MADSGNELIGWRIVQGVGAALMNPATLAIIAATFPPRERGTAIGIWAGVSALALAIGPLVGGLITEHASWNWVFLINVPVGILGIVASYLLIDESRDTSETSASTSRPVHVGARPVLAHVRADRGEHYGWTSARILALFGSRRVLLVGFVVWSCARAPDARPDALPERHVRRRERRDAARRLAMFGVFFYVSLYMQNILGFSAVAGRRAFLPMTLLIIWSPRSREGSPTASARAG
jgi:MFS family permease